MRRLRFNFRYKRVIQRRLGSDDFSGASGSMQCRQIRGKRWPSCRCLSRLVIGECAGLSGDNFAINASDDLAVNDQAVIAAEWRLALNAERTFFAGDGCLR